MHTSDPRIRHERDHNQDLFIPSKAAWRDIVRCGTLDGMPVPVTSWIAHWVDAHSDIDVSDLAVVQLRNQWWLVPLLRLGGLAYRVHFEDVICEHCNRRCGMSATPDAVLYAGTGLSPQEVWAEFAGLPIEICPHCGGLLRRRQTIWLDGTEKDRKDMEPSV